MAKSKRIANAREHESASNPAKSGGVANHTLFTASTGLRIATAMSAAAIVYVAYWTHDSTEVQQGAARYLVAWLIAAATIALLSVSRVSRVDHAIDWLAWGIASWMTASLVVNANDANLRLGINELGWWIAIAALVSAGRRVAICDRTASSLLRLIITVSVGVAVYAWHQRLIGFPQLISEYKANPDAMLRQVGIVAEQGSAMRIIFENRLYDGGPTGTFALANSMAVMLVGSSVAMVGILFTTWRNLGVARRMLWVGAIAVVGGMLLATRSRSAVLSLLLLAGWLILSQIPHRHHWLQEIRRWWRYLTASLMVALGSTIGLGYAWRNTEWIQQAPASLAIRFNYWRACFEMIRQSPWFGVGPGQFKSRYELFRAAASSEQIADPHQFLLQTLTAGGVPALLLLVALMGLVTWSIRQRSPLVFESSSRTDHAPETEARNASPSSCPTLKDAAGGGVSAGVLIAMGGVWFVGAGLGQLPMFDAAMLATLVALGFAVLAWYGSDHSETCRVNFLTIRSIAGYAAIAMGIDLLASGGMTVPGVSVLVWVLAGIAAPVRPTTVAGSQERITGEILFLRHGVASIAVASLVAFYVTGIEPLEKSRMLKNRFEQSWSRGQIDTAVATLEEATQEDRWDVEPWLQLASVFRSLAIENPENRSSWEQKWLVAEQEAALRSNRDPVISKQLGDGRLLYYQKYGDPTMLEAANLLYQKAVELSPSHEAYAAQWAEILRELGDKRAKATALRALELSLSGGYYERSLDFTIILSAKFRENSPGEMDSQGPASELLAELLLLKSE